MLLRTIRDSYIHVAHLVLAGSSRAGGGWQQWGVRSSPGSWSLAKTWRQCARRVRLPLRLETRAGLVEGNPGCLRMTHAVMGILRRTLLTLSISVLLRLSIAVGSVVRWWARLSLVVRGLSRFSLWGDHVWHLPVAVHPWGDPGAAASPEEPPGRRSTWHNKHGFWISTPFHSTQEIL